MLLSLRGWAAGACRLNAKVLSLSLGSGGFKIRDIVQVRGQSRGGRVITKWLTLRKLGNFRPAFVPPNVRDFGECDAVYATKTEAATAAAYLASNPRAGANALMVDQAREGK